MTYDDLSDLDQMDRAVLVALLGGTRTKEAFAEKVGVPAESMALWVSLTRLICRDLLFMKVVDAHWEYYPTARARRRAVAA